ncbi:amino acid adenylation domain-containing protein [Sorangium sp. So ce1151]|uniref:amino acid adenylation domain-containing protein n=1 Tax=Sorangium sp. So ce1151 TaxID=3133332 RepID=UPI003F5F3D70
MEMNEVRLRRAMAVVLQLQRRNEELESQLFDPIAIISLSCRLPGGVETPQDYWKLLSEGKDAIVGFPPRWDGLDIYDPDPEAVGKTYTREGGFLRDIERFDAGFFGISTREARSMDPQQRLVLEASWEAIERAGLLPESLRESKTGVYIGAMSSDYGFAHRSDLEALDGYQGTGNASSIISGRVAYVLGLQGPAVTVDTACSSSLVALHLACGALRKGECDLALAGGVTVISNPGQFVEYSRLKASSPDGRCRSFSARANGAGWSEGCGVLLLKRLAIAQRDGDRVLGVIRASAVNQDGRSQGLTAPNGPAQQRVIRDALAAGRLAPADIDAVEAHGTGTTLGDPIEAGALAEVFGPEREATRPLYLGSSKSNLGHTQAAAGVAGVMKMLLSLEHELLPKTLHAEEPTPHLTWEGSGLSLLQEARPWPRGERPRRAGVSSFGLSGTNAHVILEEAPAVDVPSTERTSRCDALPLLVSGRDEASLRAQAGRWAAWLRERREPLCDLAYTASAHRTHFEARSAVVATSLEEAVEALDAAAEARPHRALSVGNAVAERKLAILFTGQGSQRAGMGQGLYGVFADFTTTFDEVCAALDEHLEQPLRAVIFAHGESEATQKLHETQYTQPALFALEVALFRQWQAWGITPVAVAGHSIGELSAAHVAGVLSLADAAKLVCARGRLMQACERGGAMASIEASEAEILAALGGITGRLSIAALNGPRQTVVSGDEDAVLGAAQHFAQRGRRTKRLRVSHAFHSAHMDAMLADFTKVAESCSYAAPNIAIVSTLTGEWLGSDLAAVQGVRSASYWVRQVREAVRFVDAMRMLHEHGTTAYLECGPSGALTAMVAGCVPEDGRSVFISSLRGDHEPRDLCTALGALHVAGLSAAWRSVFAESGARRVDAPTYAFQGQRHWLDSPRTRSGVRSVGLESRDHPWLGAATTLAEGQGHLLAGLVSSRDHAWLRDHVVFGAVLVPGTGLLEITLAAAQAVAAVGVKELTLSEPLLLREGREVRLQVVIGAADDEGRRAIAIYSQEQHASESGAWRQHAAGELREAADAGARLYEDGFAELSTWSFADSERVDLGGFYDRLREQGFEYGPAFQGLIELRRRGSAAYGRVVLPEPMQGSSGAFGVHPALLDAALHTLAGALDRPAEAGSVLLPFAWSDVELFARGATELRVRVEIKAGDGSEHATAQVLIADGAGNPVLRVGALAMRKVRIEQLQALRRAGTEHLYRVEFQPLHRAEAPAATDTVVVLGGDGSLARTLGAASFPDLESARARLGAGAVPRRWILDATGTSSGGDIGRAAQRAAIHAMTSLQRMLAEPRLSSAELLCVTRRAMSAGGLDVGVDLEHAPLWGLVRAARSEHPERAIRLLDLDGSALDAALVARAVSASNEPELSLRDGRILVARLVRAAAEPAREAPRGIAPEGTVLITGGTGWLGQALARHLVRSYEVRHLVLTSRRGEEAPGVASLVQALNESGAETVRVVACDVSQRDQVAEVLRSVSAEHPWTAVMHLSGVLDDATLENQSADRFERVMAPKVQGAMHLHELTEGMDLGAFVLFSSAAGTLGGAGQSAYAAANTFLDALAAHRRRLGRAATSLAWGLFEPDGGGMAAHLGEADLTRMRRQGVSPLSLAEGLRLFDAALACSEAALVPIKLDLVRMQRTLDSEGREMPAFLRGIAPPKLAKAGSSQAASKLRDTLAVLPEPERRAALKELVQREAAAVLGVSDVNTVAPGKHLQELGLDSLMAVDLRNRLSKATQTTLPANLAFDYPTLDAMAAHLLEKVLSEPAAPKAAWPAVERAESRDVHPATEGQRRLWFLEQLQPGSAQYHMAVRIRIDGTVDLATLDRAVAWLVARHEALRTHFEMRDGELWQIVDQRPASPVVYADLSTLAEDERQSALQRHLREEESTPFDLYRDRLFRCLLLDLGRESRPPGLGGETQHPGLKPGEQVLCLTMHHSITDGWSVSLLLEELFDAYQAFVGGTEPRKPPAVHHLGDYARWERRCSAEGKFDAALRYFEAELAGMRRLDLPPPPEPASTDKGGDAVYFTVPMPLRTSLEAVAARASVTPFTLLASAFAVLLARYTGQQDFGLGTVLANRQMGGVEGTAGFLSNTLVLRCTLENDPSFEELLATMKPRVLGLLEHQHVPLTDVVRIAGGERTGDENPLFRAAFIYESLPLPTRAGQTWHPLQYDSIVGNVRGASKFELGLILTPTAAGLRGELEFLPSALDRPSAERLVRNLATLLASIAEEPTRKLSELAVLSDDDRAWLDAHGGALELVAPQFESALDLVLAQVERTPDGWALTSRDRELTYAQLAASAASLARRLRTAGVGPEDLVGLYLPRGIDLPVAMLAAWMAGAAYVPLDPDYPKARIDHVVEDSGLQVVITCKAMADHVAYDGVHIVLVDADHGSSPESDRASPSTSPSAAPSTLAYVLYTSGSTGKPKGVMLEHGQFANFCRAMDLRVAGGASGAGKTWLAVTSISFDISGLELLWTLTRGYRVVVAQGGVADLASYRKYAPTHLQCTPSMARLLLADAAGRALLQGLERMLVGGEALDRGLAKKLTRACGGTVTNMYGPTETCVWSSTWDVRGDAISLGDPILNTTFYVLDSHRNRVPKGSYGELWIGGLGVARGYLGRPELSRERFVPDPYHPSGRMYRTGDRVRYRADGSLEFCGRMDTQIKLRGHRIELGEIESVASEHPAVAECAAVVRRDASEDPKLCLYWVSAAGLQSAEHIEHLAEHLAKRLPVYMVPSHFVQMDELPHTPNKKVDRNALLRLPPPVGAIESTHAPTPSLARHDSMEDLVAGAWTRVLGVPHVDREKGFFEIGGTSMTALAAHQLICKELGREFPLSTLFHYPTVRKLSAFLQEGDGKRPLVQRELGSPAHIVERAALLGSRSDAIAIVGLAGRFPGAPNIDAFWANLRNAVESIIQFSDDELRGAGVSDEELSDPNYVRAKGYLADADLFDADFFGYSLAEAEILDPQHRLFLECAWEALEHAGLLPERFAGRIGIFGGAGYGGYTQPEVAEDLASFYRTMTSTKDDYMVTRVAHKLNLRGPALTVQTACSTGLVALHLARESLLRGECDAALAGASSLSIPLKHGYRYQEGLVASPDGKCRAFDEEARGTVFGNGVAVVVLRRLNDALRSGDRIHAVIRGSAINNDGSAKVGFTAPSIEGQSRVIAAALDAAGVGPESISYIEAHGTATALGDPIEVQALQQVFGFTDRAEPCALGSVKTNIGHLDATAGVAGLVKAVLCLRHRELVPSLHFERPNPEIGLDPNTFYVNTALRPWEVSETPRRAGVSSFGIGGTNAHVILEEAPTPAAAEAALAAPRASAFPIVISGRSEQALRAQAERWASWLREHPAESLRDVAYTAAERRTHFEWRASVMAASSGEAVDALAALAEDRSHRSLYRAHAGECGKVVFVFPGQGSHWAAMGKALLAECAEFAKALVECDDALRPWTGFSVLALVRGEEDRPLDRVDVVQPALFAMYVALAAAWRSLGLEPAAVVGHSQGEIAAAVVAGALSLDEGARIVAVRSRALRSCAGQGEMAIVELPVAEVEALLAPHGGMLSIAAVNTPSSTVVSGDAEALERLLEELDDRDVFCGKLHADCASHSRYMDALLPGIRSELSGLAPKPTKVPFYSTVTGGVLPGEALTGAYFCRNLREPVRFDRALSRLVEDGYGVFVEVSPHPVLAMPMTNGTAEARGVVVGTLQREHGDLSQMLRTLGILHAQGHAVDWTRALGGAPGHVELPTYAFQRQRYWREPKKTRSDVQSMGLASAEHPWLRAATTLADGESYLLLGRLSLAEHPWLREHANEGTVLVPATALLELALVACRAVGAGRVSELALGDPLLVTRAVRLQVVVAGADEQGRRAFTIHSQPEDSTAPQSWTRHATGELLEPSYAEAEQPLNGGTSYDVALPERMKASAASYEVHPALLEAALRSFTCPANDLTAADPLLRPVGWFDVELYAAAPTELRVRVEQLSPDDGEEVRARLWMSDSNGAPVARVGEVRLRRVSAQKLRDSARTTPHLYGISWTALRLPEAAAEPPTFVAMGDVESLLSRPNEAMSGRRKVVVDATSFAMQTEPHAFGGDAVRTATFALTLLQRLLSEPALASTQIAWVTRRAVSTGSGDGAENLPQSSLWGLLRTARAEHPDRNVRLVDVDSETSSSEIVARALAALDEPEIAIRGGVAYVPRLVHAVASESLHAAPLDREGTVLVTGGTGDLGRAVAMHLVRARGVRHLVLTSRRGLASPGASALVDDLLAIGAQSVRVVACDVSRRADVAAVLSGASAAHPWTAVFHLAGVLDDGLLADQTHERFEAVMVPKVRGAMHLHELTQRMNLAAFVLFSSASGVMGTAGQSNYAAANTFLDALAAHRRSQGLPAISLAWGLWAQQGRGMSAHLTKGDFALLRRQGIAALSLDEGLRLLDAALSPGLSGSSACLVPVKLDQATLQRALDRGGEVPTLFRAMLRSRPRRAGRSSPTPSALRERLRVLPDAERVTYLTQVLQREVAVVLALSAETIAPDRPLQQLGMNSLMAVAIRGQLSRLTDLPLSTEIIFRHASCAGIARHLLELLEMTPRSLDDTNTAQGAANRAEKNEENAWLRVLKPAIRPRARIFCFSGMGGATSGHLPLIRYLPADIEIVAAQLPGREGRKSEPAITDMNRLADEITAAICERFDTATLLYGYSQGAWLGLEVARRLQTRPGRPPVGFVVATALPPAAEMTPAVRELSKISEVWDTAPTNELALRFKGALPDDLLKNEELFSEYVAALRADLKLAHNHQNEVRHQPQAPLSIPILAVSATRDPLLPEGAMDQWAALTTHKFEHRSIDGTHAAPIENPAAMAQELVRAIPEPISERRRSPETRGDLCAE